MNTTTSGSPQINPHEIDVVSPTGKLLARLGDFEGVDCDGLPHVLLFPASPAFSNDRKFLLVTDLVLDFRILV